MDSRLAWFTPEKLGSVAIEQWMKIWEIEQGVEVNNRHLSATGDCDAGRGLENSNNSSAKTQGSKQTMEEFIPLDDSNSNRIDFRPNINQTQPFHKRRRENKASTWGLNHSSCKHILETNGLTPWKAKAYPRGALGSVF